MRNEATRHLVVNLSMQLLQASYQQHEGRWSSLLWHSPGFGVLCVSAGAAVRRKRDLSTPVKNHEFLCGSIGQVHHGTRFPITRNSYSTARSFAS